MPPGHAITYCPGSRYYSHHAACTRCDPAPCCEVCIMSHPCCRIVFASSSHCTGTIAIWDIEGSNHPSSSPHSIFNSSRIVGVLCGWLCRLTRLAGSRRHVHGGGRSATSWHTSRTRRLLAACVCHSSTCRTTVTAVPPCSPMAHSRTQSQPTRCLAVPARLPPRFSSGVIPADEPH